MELTTDEAIRLAEYEYLAKKKTVFEPGEAADLRLLLSRSNEQQVAKRKNRKTKE